MTDPHNYTPAFGQMPTGGLQLVAATPNAGFALQNATPTILSWTAPNDGQKHHFLVYCTIVVAVTEVGGAVGLTSVLGGQSGSPQINAGAAAGPALVNGNYRAGICDPGSTVSIAQTSALTGGTATLWAAIWAALYMDLR